MILTFFYREFDPYYHSFFITHFLICHSFLDSYIRHDLARNWGTGFWRESCAGRPGWHSGTVAQSHSTLSLRLNRRALVCNTSLRLNRSPIMSRSRPQSRSHVTPPTSPPKPTNTKIPLLSISHYVARKLKWI